MQKYISITLLAITMCVSTFVTDNHCLAQIERSITVTHSVSNISTFLMRGARSENLGTPNDQVGDYNSTMHFIARLQYANDTPIPGVKLTFTLESKGAQATISSTLSSTRETTSLDVITDASGQASVHLHAGATDGSYTIIVVSSAAQTSPESVQFTATVPGVSFVPDYDRNGIINDNDRFRVTSQQPWRIWVNDDADNSAGPETGTLASSETDMPNPTSVKNDIKIMGGTVRRNTVDGPRDLIDFFPLYLDLSHVLSNYPINAFTYTLRHEDEALSMFEALNFTPTNLPFMLSNVGYYLKEVGLSLGSKSVQVISNSGVQLSQSFLERAHSGGHKIAMIFVEGRKESTAPLVLEITNGYVTKTFEMPLDICNVEDMFGHKNLRSIASCANEEPDKDILKAPFSMGDTDKTLVWMHGYNVDYNAARATFSEVFKRFFHSGFDGKFYGISWWGDPPAFGAPHYHQAVVNAFATAKSYKDFVSSLEPNPEDQIYIAAHSLGNMVVGVAFQDHALEVSKYFAINSAVPLEAYGPLYTDIESLVGDVQIPVNETEVITPIFSGDPSSMIRVADWPLYIKAGQKRLLASEWYKLFESDDERSKLTWRGRFDQVLSKTQMYNFHSSTEEVLRAYENDNEVWDGAGLKQDNWQMYCWAKTEKFKGRRSQTGVYDLGGATSDFGGWGYNLTTDTGYWREVVDPNQYPATVMVLPITPYEIISRTPPTQHPFLISNDLLKTRPFFRIGPTSGPIYNELVDELFVDQDNGANDFLEKKISETELRNYYTDNSNAQSLVKVKDWLLAEAFPATSLAAGLKPLVQQGVALNIDMSHDVNGCKTNPNTWPGIDSDWRHSDYKDIMYQHVYKFYNRIVEIIERPVTTPAGELKSLTN